MNQQKQPGIWEGVKIGCGIFIVLPMIVVAILILIITVTTCAKVRQQERDDKREIELMQPPATTE